jgi:hypothetical protein
VTVGLVGALAVRMGGRGRRRMALAAMGLAAVYPPLVLAGGSLLSESLSLPLEIGSLLAAWVAGTTGGRGWRPLRWCGLTGLLCGLDVLCRPDSIVLLVPTVLLVSWSSRALWREALLRAAVVVGVAGLTVTPWLVRDALAMGRFVPVTTQAGLVASGTYNDTAAHDPDHPAAWRPTNLVPEYRPLLRGTEIQEESALRSAALHYIRTHPGYPLRAAGWNLLRLFDLTGLSDPRASWGANGFSSGVAALDAYGLVALAVLGLYGAARLVVNGARRRRGVEGPALHGAVVDGPAAGVLPGATVVPESPAPWPGVVWLAPVLLLLVTIPVLGESRLRVGLDPFLVLLVARGLVG